MKQTNNAIKFLMAQYRAIFRNANLKMFLAAATAAAALSAGQAQAQNLGNFDDTKLNDTGITNATIDGKDSASAYNTLTLTGKANRADDAPELTLTVTSGTTHTMKGTVGKTDVKLGNTSLTLKAENKTDAKLIVSADDADTNVSLKHLSVVKGVLEVGKTGGDKQNSISATTIDIGGEAGEADVTLWKSAQLKGQTLNVEKGAAVTLNNAAKILSSEINVKGGAISLSGGADADLAVLGSETSTVAITGGEVKSDTGKQGAIIGSKITLSGKDTKLINAESLTITAGVGGFTATGGTIENKTAAKTITFVGDTKILSGTTIDSSGSIAFKGNASIADDVTLTLGDAAVTKVIADASTTSTLSVGKKAFGTLTNKDGQKISVSGAAGATTEIHFTDDVVNLGETGGLGIIKTADGKLEDKKIAIDGGNQGKLKLSANKVELKIAKIDQANVEIAANEMTVGTGASFIISGDSTLQVGHLLTVDDGTKELKIDKGSVFLTDEKNQSGNTIAAKTITIGKDASNKGNLNVTAGDWSVSGIDLKYGAVNVSNEAVLHLAGDLTTTKDGKLVGSNTARIDATKVGKLTLGETSVELNNSAVLDLDVEDALAQDGYAAKAVSGASTSTINLKSGDALATMDKTKFQELSKKAEFGGLWGVNIEGLVAEGTTHMGLGGDNGIISGVGSGYQDVQADVDGTTAVDKNYSAGNVHLTKGDALTIGAGSMTLQNAQANNADGKFVSTGTGADSKLAGVKFDNTATADSAIKFEGAGSVGAITIDDTKKGMGRVEVGGEGKKTADLAVSGGIGSATASIGELTLNEGSTLTVKGGDVFVKDLNLNDGTTLNAQGQAITVDADSAPINSTLTGAINAGKLEFKTSATQGNTITLAGNTESNIGTLFISGKQDLEIGQGGVEAAEGVEASSGSFAQVYTDKLILAEGSTLFLDPAYGQKASLLVAKDFANAITPGADSDVLKSSLVIGSNSALGLGFTKEEFGDVMADYLIYSGGFSNKTGDVHNALVLGKPLKINSGVKLDIDYSKTTSKPDGVLAVAAQANEVLIAPGSALILTENAFGPNGEAAIQFQGTTGTIVGGSATSTAADGAETKVDIPLVILEGDFNAVDTVNLASVKNGGNPSAAKVKGKFLVEAYDGLLSYMVDDANGTSTASFVLQYQESKEGAIRSGVSTPVADIFIDKAKGKLEIERGSLGYGFLVQSMKSAEGRKQFDAAAHAATYAGAQQAAVAAVGTMAEAVGGRVGSMGVEVATISATGSQANGGVWLSPMYKSVDADGFNAEGASYGADVDLGGVAFGADTVNGNMRFGAVFNIGSGDADGKGNGNGLKDEFDYYGFGMYTVMGFGQFALVGDASLNVISHDVKGLDAKASADTTAVTMGVTGQYTISNPAVDVTPHVGARFIRLDTDSYDLNTADGVLAQTDFDVQNVFSVPLGVTLSKAFEMGGWSLAPSADLSITFNTGDTDVKSTTRFDGIKRDIGLTTEVLDEVTYGVAVGLGAQYGAFGTQIGINYTGSSNTDAFGVNANARYMF